MQDSFCDSVSSLNHPGSGEHSFIYVYAQHLVRVHGAGRNMLGASRVIWRGKDPGIQAWTGTTHIFLALHIYFFAAPTFTFSPREGVLAAIQTFYMAYRRAIHHRVDRAVRIDSEPPCAVWMKR